jgi:hypothetical protein
MKYLKNCEQQQRTNNGELRTQGWKQRKPPVPLRAKRRDLLREL